MKTKILAILLTMVMFTVGCTASWINVALQDLPVLLQMALNIATLASTFSGAQAPSQNEINAINQIAAEASKDLSLLQTLYNQYESSPSPELLGQMENVIADINTNLPALLTAAHIQNATLQQQVTAAVGLILTTVTSFAALIPQPTNPAVQAMKATLHQKPLGPNDLKKAWNAQVRPQFKVKTGWHRFL